MKTLIINALRYSSLSAKGNYLENVDLNQLIGELQDDFEVVIHKKNAQIVAVQRASLSSGK